MNIYRCIFYELCVCVLCKKEKETFFYVNEHVAALVTDIGG